MRRLKQTLVLLEMSLRGLRNRLGPTLVIIIGTACVVGVLISMLSMGAGARRMAVRGARADRVFVVAGGSQGSGTPLTRETVATIIDSPAIKRDQDGKPLAFGVAMSFGEGRTKRDNGRVGFPIIGVQVRYLGVIPELRVTAGRMFRPGVHELIVGRNRHEEERGLEIGDHLRLLGDDWTVVGHFETGGLVDDTLITDAETLMSAFHLSTFQHVHAVLGSAERFDELKKALETNPSIRVEVKHEEEYLAEQSKQLRQVLDFVSYFIGGIMGFGATAGAVNAMYVVVDERRRELATLSAIGFGGFALIASVLIESLLVALPGAVIGAAGAWMLFNGHHISPAGMAFDLAVTPGLVILGVVWALCMGLIGGLLPALRAARVSVATALRAT